MKRTVVLFCSVQIEVFSCRNRRIYVVGEEGEGEGEEKRNRFAINEIISCWPATTEKKANILSSRRWTSESIEFGGRTQQDRLLFHWTDVGWTRSEPLSSSGRIYFVIDCITSLARSSAVLFNAMTHANEKRAEVISSQSMNFSAVKWEHLFR